MGSHLIYTQGASFVVDETDNLLEALERTGHEIEYQCRSGYCGSCRIKKRSGQVVYDELPLAFVGSDEILPCCCRAASDLTLECGAEGVVSEQENGFLAEG